MSRPIGPLNPTPHMERVGAERLAQLMRKAGTYMEYGCGGSTMLAGEIGVPVIISTDSDFAFCDEVRSQFSPKYLRSTLVSLHADIGPTKEWGHPVDSRKKGEWPIYAAKAWRFVIDHGYQPDLVLIDGRFRTACVLMTLLFARTETPILLDDYIGRDYASALEPILQPSAMYGRMAEFYVPKNRDLLLPKISHTLSEAFTNPN